MPHYVTKRRRLEKMKTTRNKLNNEIRIPVHDDGGPCYQFLMQSDIGAQPPGSVTNFFHSEWHSLCLEHLSCYTGKHYSSLCTLVHICSCSVPGVVPRHVPRVVPIDVPSSSSFCNIVRHSHKTGNRILSMCWYSELLPVTLVSPWLNFNEVTP